MGHQHYRYWDDPGDALGHDSWQLSLSPQTGNETETMSKVLVTGGSGFIGGHAILQLLAAGHQVCTTVRSMNRESDVRATLKQAGTEPGERLSFFVADLLNDTGWPAAVAGCDYVLHVASPFPAAIPQHEDELIVPAREGSLRVLRAARDAGVKRVVLTSSFAAIGYGHRPQTSPFNETDWTDPNGEDVTPYVKSKTLAERAAWDFIAKEGRGLEQSVVNPVGVFGPVLGHDYATSILIVQRLMDGAMPGSPKLCFGIVDVRDVVDLHLRAMTHPAAKGERFLAVAGDFMWIAEMAKVLKARLGSAAKRVPRRELPNWLVRLAALREPAVKQIIPELGKTKNATNEKARRVLGWTPRSNEDAVVATAESLVRLGLLKDSPQVQA
jgi:nucleoside-diphosphate-sugar epimerase